MSKGIDVNDLPDNLRKEILRENGISTKGYTFSMEDVRRASIGVLAVVKHLDKGQRKRVLHHALKVNEV